MACRQMTRADLANLQPGDIIRHKNDSKSLVVSANYGDHAIAVRTTHVSNPSEWLVFAPREPVR